MGSETFEYTDRFRLKTFAFPAIVTALLAWVGWNETLPVRVMLSAMWLVFALEAFVIITNPFRFEITGDILVARYYGGMTRKWRVAELTLSNESLVASLFAAREMRTLRAKRAFLFWKPLPRLDEFIALFRNNTSED